MSFVLGVKMEITNLQIQRVSYDEKSILQNLMELYQYETSPYEDEGSGSVNEYGLFGYKYLDHYWTEEGRYPYFIRVSGKLAGFVLVRELETLQDGITKRSIAEFFVMRRYQAQGIGRNVARQIFDMFAGKWSVSHLGRNVAASRFWRNVISEYTDGEYGETIYAGNPAFEFTSMDKE
jgi:predicted acetyltransferase